MATRRSTLKGAVSLAATAVLAGCNSYVTGDRESTVSLYVNNNTEERKTVTLWVVRDSELVLGDTVSAPPEGDGLFDETIDVATVATWRVTAQVDDGPTIAKQFRKGRFDDVVVDLDDEGASITTVTYG